MNKEELISQIAKKTNMSKSAILGMTNAMIETIEKSISKGDHVKLVGFGTWEKRRRKERMGRNPQNGKPLRIPARNTVSWRPGADLIDLIN